MIINHVLNKLSNNAIKKWNVLKWYYAHISLQNLGCNCYIIQKIVIYDEERHMTIAAAQIKE